MDGYLVALNVFGCIGMVLVYMLIHASVKYKYFKHLISEECFNFYYYVIHLLFILICVLGIVGLILF